MALADVDQQVLEIAKLKKDYKPLVTSQVLPKKKREMYQRAWDQQIALVEEKYANMYGPVDRDAQPQDFILRNKNRKTEAVNFRNELVETKWDGNTIHIDIWRVYAPS